MFFADVEAVVKADGGLFICHISRKEVETCDLQRVLSIVDAFEHFGRNARGKLVILFSGYDHIPQEIYEIPAIRAWVAELFAQKPHCLYFVTTLQNIFQLLIACVANIQTFKSLDPVAPVVLNISVPKDTYAKIHEALRAYATKVGDREFLKLLESSL